MLEQNPFLAWRTKEGIGPAEAALRCGVRRQTWWRWERSMSNVEIGKLEQVSEVTGIPRARLRPDIFEAAQ